jgi:5-methylcytosine-specific restriction endonuclease McrA
MIKRTRHIKLSTYPPKQNAEGAFVCLNCEAPVIRKRAKKYCSRECTDEFFTKNNHGRLRSKLIKLAKRSCQLCLRTYPKAQLILDHKIPIALGGPEFDEANLQIICVACNRVKTREDRLQIGAARRREHDTRIDEPA